MKESENQEPSSMAGAAKGGNTSEEIVGSAVSAAVGELVASDDYVLMPKRLTAENGAKGALSGEFKESVEVTCPACDGSGNDPDFDGAPTEHGSACPECNGEGTIAQDVLVSWDTIKDIYKAAVALLAAPTQAAYLARQSQAKPVEQASKITDGDSARSFVAQWHRDHFPTDRTFTNYIMGRNRHCALAGDFAWQLAKALESFDARLAAPTQVSAPQALAEMEARKDAAYLERNRVVAALAKCFPSGIARTAIEGWSEDWHGCVYIDLPTGQVSWHFHDSQAYLFDGLPVYQGVWDGHDTMEKYCRVAALQVSAPQAEELRQLRNRVSQLEAARFAYASELPPIFGEPDVGRILANIRALKAMASASQDGQEGLAVRKAAIREVATLVEGFDKRASLHGIACAIRAMAATSSTSVAPAAPDEVRNALLLLATATAAAPTLTGHQASALKSAQEVIQRTATATGADHE